jgi:iron complex outermembrane receptor protein
MTSSKFLRQLAGGTALALCVSRASLAANFDVPGGDLDSALQAYIMQSGVQLMVPNADVRGIRTRGAKGNLSDSEALGLILKGTGFVAKSDSSGALGIVRESHGALTVTPLELAQAAPISKVALETVTVTSSKLGGADVQSIPISITALSQEQLTATQTAGGPDLVKQVPNLTFTKTNFTGYSINIRGIGTQAISVTTDPAVAVALNDIPFIRNHFFEQEFYDLGQAEVLRGPQGTLYGRNATAGVVNLTTAKPTDQFEAMASGELGNYNQRRFEGMINLPIVDDRLDIRVAGEWTKRQGYSFNESTGQRIDGRDLWSGRVSIAWKPIENFQSTLIWEHFSEDDDRMRTSKQLCKTAPIPAAVDGVDPTMGGNAGTYSGAPDYLSQGCLPTSLYSADAFQVPNGYTLSYYAPLNALIASSVRRQFNIYASTTQSQNLRVIESAIDPIYKAKNDTLEFNNDYAVAPSLTLTSQTGFNQDFLWSTEDYNRFNSAPGAFVYNPGDPQQQLRPVILPDPNGPVLDGGASGIFCDPQLGCSDRLVAQDLSEEHAWQLSQEFRLASNFAGPFNFSVGGNYLHYETEENYFVFINSLTLFSEEDVRAALLPPVAGSTANPNCLPGGFRAIDPTVTKSIQQSNGCIYVDPNPISSLNEQGHNYFLSQNPYTLNSYAAFGEANYAITDELKVTAGLRWTQDRKHFIDIPSELIVFGYGYTATGAVDQQWDQLTGRAVVNWTPKLNFTDQTLIYGSYGHGYKAGGANPPGAVLLIQLAGEGEVSNPIHPLTFKPEFVDAFELGSKNTMLDGALTFNADVFYYNYENYQISEIVDRTSINLNFDAHVKGAEIESTWEPVPGLRVNFAGGWEDTSLARGDQAVDLMDRTAGNSDWIVVKPWVTQASNCILPTYVVAAKILAAGYFPDICGRAYAAHEDPVTSAPFVPNPTGDTGGQPIPAGYPGFDPVSPTAPNNGAGPAPNNGEGFDKNLSGNELPNAPPFTVSFGAQYTMPITVNWAGTLRGDYYWQDYSWARVFNDNPYDRLRGYTNVNLALILTNQNGWQVMFYDKNIFNETAITGTFLNSDDSGLTTNVFLTDPKLIGVRITKNW